jgi:ADP-heptose:LPS heptosyltransferase
MLKDIKKIAILRANAVGDFIVTLPAIDAIRKKYPAAELVLLGKPWHKEFVIPGRTPIDRVIVVPVKKGIRDEVNETEDSRKLEEFFEKMQEEQFDIVLHFQGNGVSANPFINRFNAKLTVGLSSENADHLDRSINFYYYQSEVLRYLEVASLIGAKTENTDPNINVLEQDFEEIKGILSYINKPFVVLNPFATDIKRSWPLENFVPVAERLFEKGFQVVFTGLKEHFISVEKIISELKTKAINLCGSLSLGGLCAMIKKSELIISADTGPLHLGRAVNTPSVGLYWAPNLINWGPLFRNIHRPLISWNMACPFCGIIPNQPYPFQPQNDCTHNISFIRDIPVSAVCETAENLLLQRNTAKKSGKKIIENQKH